MNTPIRIEYPRDLMLENVVSVQVDLRDEERVIDSAQNLARLIKSKGGFLRGPLIQKTDSALVGQNGEARSEFLRQSSTEFPATGIYEFRSRVEVLSCVMASFHGSVADMPVVYSKLAVFSYEQGVPLNGTIYIVYKSDEGPIVSADFFAATR